jgi:hypothetical protein
MQAWIDAYKSGRSVVVIARQYNTHPEVVRKAIVASGSYVYRSVSHYRKYDTSQAMLRKCLDCLKQFKSVHKGNRICDDCVRLDHRHGVID